MDSVAFVGVTYKKCNPGTYVHPNNAPGKTPQDCNVCPEGKAS